MASFFEPIWSQRLQTGVRGLCLARESGDIVAWDRNDWVHRFNASGQRQAQARLPAVVQAVCSDDGSGFAAVAGREVFWLGGDLRVRWQKTLSAPALALAVDPFGQYLAVSDSSRKASLFDCRGQPAAELSVPRAFRHLAFVPAAPLIAGCADYGLVGCFDLAGEVRWQHGLVANTAGLAVAGDGSVIAVACFSEGIQRYDSTGKDLGRMKTPEACRLLAVSFEGSWLVSSDLRAHLYLTNTATAHLEKRPCREPLTALALGALADFVVVGSEAGEIVKARIRNSGG